MTTRKRSTKTASPTTSATDERSESLGTDAALGTDGGDLLGLFRSGMGVMDSTTALATRLPRTLLGGFGTPQTDDAGAERPAQDDADVPSPRAAALHGTLDGISMGGFKVAGRSAAMVDDLLGLIKS